MVYRMVLHMSWDNYLLLQSVTLYKEVVQFSHCDVLQVHFKFIWCNVLVHVPSSIFNYGFSRVPVLIVFSFNRGDV